MADNRLPFCSAQESLYNTGMTDRRMERDIFLFNSCLTSHLFSQGLTKAPKMWNSNFGVSCNSASIHCWHIHIDQRLSILVYVRLTLGSLVHTGNILAKTYLWYWGKVTSHIAERARLFSNLCVLSSPDATAGTSSDEAARCQPYSTSGHWTPQKTQGGFTGGHPIRDWGKT